ncbi:tyrosine-type recombinase/integrase [Thermobaculum terrenum]|nr:tyrosine-type recombinase/integrase [Thermobaculum terrenum]
MAQEEKDLRNSVQDFLDYCLVEEGLSPASVRTYQQVLYALVDWLELRLQSKAHVSNLDKQSVKAWQRYLVVEKQLDDDTYVKYISALRSFVNYLHDEDLTSLTRDDIKLPKSHMDVSSIKALSVDDVRALLMAPDPSTPWGKRDRALLALLYCTGMRIAELCSLNRDQLPLEHLCEDEILEVSIIGKGRKPRVVFVDAVAQRLLKEYLQLRTDENPALFVSFKGPTAEDRLTPRAIQMSIKKYAKKAGLKTIPTPHTMRHTFAVHKLQGGADTRIVQAFLGHSSLATTQRYTRVTDRYLRESYERTHIPADLD